MVMMSFARIQCRVEVNPDAASSICLARRGDWTTDHAAPNLETL
jgi:hypothetical protein